MYKNKIAVGGKKGDLVLYTLKNCNKEAEKTTLMKQSEKPFTDFEKYSKD